MLSTRFLICLLLATPLYGQTLAPPSERISSDEAIERALKKNVLTVDGIPFHAVLETRTEKGDDPAFKSRIELFWESTQKYRLILESPNFGQTIVMNNGQNMESDRGDFYPGWLKAFVTALMDPMPRLKALRGRNDSIEIGPQVSFSCVRRDDKTAGITDQLTWAQICFSGPIPRLEFVADFTYNMDFSDFQSFGTKQIAHIYKHGTGSNFQLRGTLTTLEELKTEPSLFIVTKETLPANRIQTTFISTAAEESMLESAPQNVAWPTVREGKLEGYMIIHAVTDRTGQVRETWKHNSDNNALQSAGQEIALKYKFKPLVVDGIPQQIEMPLVLHFTTTISDPIPELDDSKTRKMITGCSLPHEINDPASAGQKIVIQFQIHEDGGLMTLGSSDRKIPIPVLYQQFRGCHFEKYQQNGKSTAYHANLTVTAK